MKHYHQVFSLKSLQSGSSHPYGRRPFLFSSLSVWVFFSFKFLKTTPYIIINFLLKTKKNTKKKFVFFFWMLWWRLFWLLRLRWKNKRRRKCCGGCFWRCWRARSSSLTDPTTCRHFGFVRKTEVSLLRAPWWRRQRIEASGRQSPTNRQNVRWSATAAIFGRKSH